MWWIRESGFTWLYLCNLTWSLSAEPTVTESRTQASSWSRTFWGNCSTTTSTNRNTNGNLPPISSSVKIQEGGYNGGTAHSHDWWGTYYSTFGFTCFAAAFRNLSGRSGSTWSGSTWTTVLALKKLLFHSSAAPEVQLHFLLLVLQGSDTQRTRRRWSREVLSRLHPCISKDNSVLFLLNIL